MNQKVILIGTILAITVISIPMIISETSPKPEQPNCDLPVNATMEQIKLFIELGCNIDIDIWDKDSPGIGNWTGTVEGITEPETSGFVIDGIGFEKPLMLPIKSTTNDSIILKNYNFDEVAGSISFDISSNNNGTLTILLPNDLYHVYVDDEVIFDPMVIINGEEIVSKKEFVDDHIILEFNYTPLSKKAEIILAWYW